MSPPLPDQRRLEHHVRRLEGPRHPVTAPERHASAARYVKRNLEAVGCDVWEHRFRHGGRTHRNVAGRLGRASPGATPILVGAHYDTVTGTPGADDNASGVATLLEVARLLREGDRDQAVELVAFDLEEPQGSTYRVGSRAWVERTGEEGRGCFAALILEMVGYTDARPGSQDVPLLLRWKRIPRRGSFLAAVGDRKSRRLLRGFEKSARRRVPELELVTSWIPLRGWIVPQSRLSDNASFWDAGIPALMLTDTAFLRNPHYHGPGDGAGTLDYEFMARVVAAVTAAVEDLATGG